MSYNVATDSDGVEHYIYSQVEPQSCALACMFMMENQVEQMTHGGGEGRLKNISGNHQGSLLASQIAGINNGQGDGTTAGNAAKTFADVGVNLTKAAVFDPKSPAYSFKWEKNRIYDQHPALILVGWYAWSKGTQKRNGGHFIVAARVTTKSYVVILDPASGTLHELHGSKGFYFNHGLRGRMEVILYTG